MAPAKDQLNAASTSECFERGICMTCTIYSLVCFFVFFGHSGFHSTNGTLPGTNCTHLGHIFFVFKLTVWCKMKTGQVQLLLCSLQKVLEKNAFELWTRHSCIRNKQACFHSTTTFKHVQGCAAELFATKEAHEVHCHVHTVHYSGDTEE
jgi:hypothetical protein